MAVREQPRSVVHTAHWGTHEDISVLGDGRVLLVPSGGAPRLRELPAPKIPALPLPGKFCTAAFLDKDQIRWRAVGLSMGSGDATWVLC